MKKILVAIGLSTISLMAMGSEDMNNYYFSVYMDKFEYKNDTDNSKAWDGYAYYGDEMHKLYLYSEGENTNDSTSVLTQLVYSQAIAPYWDIQFGAAKLKDHGGSRNWGVVALSGLAPYFFETRASLMADADGALRFELNSEYEALLTQKLILTPSLDATLYSKDIPNIGAGKGLSNLTLGLRLRYEIRREFAPYIGIEYTKNYGNTYDFEDVNDFYGVAGIKFWF